MTLGHLSVVYISVAFNTLFFSHYVSQRISGKAAKDFCSLSGLIAYWICLAFGIKYAILFVIGDVYG